MNNTKISRRSFLAAAGIAGAAAALTACGSSASSTASSAAGSAAASSEAVQNVELIVFAAASLTETLTAIGETYSAEHPEVTLSVAERNAPGIAEAMRYHSLTITPRGMLSRAASVLRGKTLIVNLPGSPKAVKENLEYILPSLAHGIRLAAGLDGECARK